MKWTISLCFVLMICCGGTLFAKPPYHLYKKGSNQGTTTNYTSSKSDSYSSIQHEVENHEIELRMFEERLNTQETILDTLRQQFLDSNLANQQMVKGNAVSLEKRVNQVDTTVSSMVKDLKELQKHSNNTAQALNQYKSKISDLERQIGQLQDGIDTIFTALQIEAPKAKGGDREYVVQSGDILDKIARKNQTTVKKIKELNKLTNDRIYVGQKLKLP